MSVESTLSFETNNAIYQFIGDDTLYVRRSERVANFNDPKQNLLDLIAHLNGRKVKVLMNNTGFPYTGKAVRTAAMEMIHEICTAMAIVAETREGHGIGSIFVASNSTTCPMKLFNNETDALAWLEAIE